MAFIAIDLNTSWQDLSIAQEIAISYNLRRSLFGLSTIATPSQDTKVFDFVSAVQYGIEEMMADGWISRSGTLSDLLGQSDYPSALTLSQCMTAAGLTASGYWRRIAEAGTQPNDWTDYSATGWSYGRIQSKDLAGPWLFKDIQLALSILTRARVPIISSRDKFYYFSLGYAPIPSSSLTWSAFGSSTGAASNLAVAKTTSGSSVLLAACSLTITEARLQIPDAVAAKETARILLVIPTEVYFTGPSSGYSSYTGKNSFSNIDVADITTALDQTVENTSSKASSAGLTTYTAILGEDASSSQPLANNILPDSSVPTNSTIDIGIRFTASYFIFDFSFE